MEKEMATHSSTLAWKILWDRGASWGIVHGNSKRVGHDLVTNLRRRYSKASFARVRVY